jgi:pyruvate kinase
MRKTKIVATLGPSSFGLIQELSNYVDVFRLNLAHGDLDQHSKVLRQIRDLSPFTPVLMDLPGPKLRVGEIPSGKVELRNGERVILGEEGIPVEDPVFFDIVRPGMEVLLSDGVISIKIEEVGSGKVTGTVLAGGVLTSRKGINVPEAVLPTGLTERDWNLLEFALKEGADMIGISFVTRPEDVREVKDRVKGAALVVSKIEKRNALSELDGIVENSDAVMVARGDLGVEIGLESLPSIQKQIVETSRIHGKPVILATQVLESMINSPIPTRAEIIDIANSVSQGVDAIMLSDETAVGHYPMQASSYLDKVIRKVEVEESPFPPPITSSDEAVAAAAVEVARVSKAKVIVVRSRSGKSVVRISKFRPIQPIVALVKSKELARRLRVCFGVIPKVVKDFRDDDVEALINDIAVPGDTIVVVGSTPKSRPGATDTLYVRSI